MSDEASLSKTKENSEIQISVDPTENKKVENASNNEKLKEPPKFFEPKKKMKEDMKKIAKNDDSDEEPDEESEDYDPSNENDVSIEEDGQNTSEHSEEIDLEDYLKFCEKNPLKEGDDEEEDDDEFSNKPSKKFKKNDDDEDIIISSKDIKNKKNSKG